MCVVTDRTEVLKRHMEKVITVDYEWDGNLENDVVQWRDEDS